MLFADAKKWSRALSKACDASAGMLFADAKKMVEGIVKGL
jgi:hypothetical protein